MSSIPVLLFLLFVILVLSGGYIVRKGTEKKNMFGIPTSEVRCPECNAAQPKFRKPKNLNQMLWGGLTCEDCGTEMDKWGREK